MNRARLQALRQAGVEAFDATGFRFVEGMLARADAADPGTRETLRRRAHARLARLEREFSLARSASDWQPPVVRERERPARRARARRPQPPVEAGAIPVGPYNPEALAARALELAGQISPAYLQACLAELDTLAALRALPAPPKRRRRT